MIREFSAGGVVVRRMRGRAWVAVIEPRGKPGVVALPKGIVDAGEDARTTALREVLEETGVVAAPAGSLGTIKYVYQRGGQRVFKLVTFELCRYRAGRIDAIAPAMRREVERAWWLPLDDAPARLSYRGEREVAERALGQLDGRI